jgi:DNA-binding TFAR19-related protein (PDSD5 family)
MLKKTLTKEELIRIINLCENIEKSGIDPFSIKVSDLLYRLRKILEKSKDIEEIVLDAETLYKISLLIAYQSKWLKQKASSLFIDYQLLAIKLSTSSIEDIALAFLKAWNPIISLEQITPYRLRQGIEYFISLPTKEKKTIFSEKLSEKELSEAIKKQLIEEKLFEENLEKIYQELLEKSSKEEVNYWNFIKKEDFKETIERAYLLSFLISTGRVKVKIDPLNEKIILKPLEKKTENKITSSLSIVINKEILKKIS